MDSKFAKNYKLGRKIGEGSFGQIFQGSLKTPLKTLNIVAYNIITKEQVAAKLEPIKTVQPQLEYENNLYKIMQG